MHRKLCDRFGWRTTPHGRRRSRNVHVLGPSRRAATATGRPQRSAHPWWRVMLREAWCVALFAIGGRASAAERLTKVATRLFLDAATAGHRPHRKWRGGTTMTLMWMWVGVNVTSTAGIVTSLRRLTFCHVVRPRSCTPARSPEHT